MALEHLFVPADEPPTSPNDSADLIQRTFGYTIVFGAVGTVTGMRVYGPTNTPPTSAAVELFRKSDQVLLRTENFVSPLAAGVWNDVNFSTPFAPVIGEEYIACYWFSGDGHYALDVGGLATAKTNLDLTAPANEGAFNTGGAQGTFPAGVTDALFWVDVNFQTAEPFTDDTGLIDTAEVQTVFALEPTDDTGLTDAVSPSVGFGLDVTDSTGLTDTAAGAVGFAVEPTDDAGLTDTAAVAAVFPITITDDTGLTDAAALSVGFGLDVTDASGLTDTAQVQAPVTLTITDDAGLTDTAQVQAPVRLEFTDSAGLTDNATTVLTSFPCEPLLAQTLMAISRLLEQCLCTKLTQTLAGAVCRCSPMSGASSVADICEAVPGMGDGQAWVRLTRVFVTGVFPQSQGEQFNCADGLWSAEFELGVLRCAVTSDDEGQPPSAAELDCEAVKIMDDAFALRWTAECCLPQSLPVFAGEWVPMSGGGCTGGRITITVLLAPGPHDLPI